MRVRIGLLLLVVFALIAWNLRFGPYRLRRMVEAGCAEAVQRAQAEFGVELDYSEGSIAKVEAIAAKVFAQQPLAEERRAELSKLLGVYLGEVARRNHGGEWLIPQEGPLAGALVLRRGTGETSPPSKVYQRLIKGDEDNLASYYQVLVRQ